MTQMNWNLADAGSVILIPIVSTDFYTIIQTG